MITNRASQYRLAILVIAFWLCSLGIYKIHQEDADSFVLSARERFKSGQTWRDHGHGDEHEHEHEHEHAHEHEHGHGHVNSDLYETETYRYAEESAFYEDGGDSQIGHHGKQLLQVESGVTHMSHAENADDGETKTLNHGTSHPYTSSIEVETNPHPTHETPETVAPPHQTLDSSVGTTNPIHLDHLQEAPHTPDDEDDFPVSSTYSQNYPDDAANDEIDDNSYETTSGSNHPNSGSEEQEVYVYDADAPIAISTDQIIIVQHFHNRDDIHMKSLENHRRYAQAHGYKYHPDMTQYIEDERNWNAKTLNKAYAILSAMLRELQDGETGAKWLFFADGGDTFFYNPSIPLAAYLPPPHIYPEPYILASQDWNGFNAGVLMLRINQRMASFFAQILGTPNTHPMLEGQSESWEASDQWIMGTLLNEGRNDLRGDHIASHFYDIPKVWLNAYSIREDEHNVGEWEAIPPSPGDSHMEVDEMTGEEKLVEAEWTSVFHPGWQPRCHIHFPAQQFQDLDELYATFDRYYEEGKNQVLTGDDGNGTTKPSSGSDSGPVQVKEGLLKLGWAEKAAKVARDWWELESASGLDNVKFFLDEGDRPEYIAI